MGVEAYFPNKMSFEAKVRKALPKDEQIVAAMIGVYFGSYALVKIKSMFSKPAPKAIEAPAAASSSGTDSKYGFEVPTLDTFGDWAGKEDNWNKWIDWLGGKNNLDEWSKTL